MRFLGSWELSVEVSVYALLKESGSRQITCFEGDAIGAASAGATSVTRKSLQQKQNRWHPPQKVLAKACAWGGRTRNQAEGYARMGVQTTALSANAVANVFCCFRTILFCVNATVPA